jgi:hypothetical protein
VPDEHDRHRVGVRQFLEAVERLLERGRFSQRDDGGTDAERAERRQDGSSGVAGVCHGLI